MLAHQKASTSPVVEMAGSVDNTAEALVAADRPVPMKAKEALGAEVLRNVVDAAITLDGADSSGMESRVECAPVLDDEVLGTC